MIKYAFIPAVILLTSCGQQTPESIQQFVDDPVALTPIDPATNNESDSAAETEQEAQQEPDNPFETVGDEQAAPQDPPAPAPQEPAPEQTPEQSEPADPEPVIADDPVDDDELIQNDVIDATEIELIAPDLYSESMCTHEWRNSTGSSIAPNPFNVCTMQITWDMADNHSYTLVLDGEEVPAPISSVWEFSIDQPGLPEDLNISALPTVQVRTCTFVDCEVSQPLQWSAVQDVPISSAIRPVILQNEGNCTTNGITLCELFLFWYSQEGHRYDLYVEGQLVESDVSEPYFVDIVTDKEPSEVDVWLVGCIGGDCLTSDRVEWNL